MRIIGIALLVLGAVVLFFGLNSSQVLPEQVMAGVTGRFTSNTMWYILGGIALLVGGGAMTILNRKL